MSEQLITLFVDIYPTSSDEWDCVYSVQQVYPPDYNPYPKADGTTRYRVQFKVPKIIESMEDATGVTVQQEQI